MLSALALAAVAILAPPGALADTGFLDRKLALAGQEYRYQVYVPHDWTRAQKWPVLVELHANGSQGADGLSHTRHSALIFEMRKDRSRFPAIVLWPQAREGTGFSAPAMQAMVLAQLDRTIEEFSGDTGRVYLTGFSM